MKPCVPATLVLPAATRAEFAICDGLIGLRVEKEHEIQGLDPSMHGEEGYILES